MFPKAALTSVLLLAMSVAATPVAVRDTLVTLPFAKQINSTGSGHIVQQDRARVQQLVAKYSTASSGLQADAASISVTNQAVSYVASVGVGSPATQYSLIVDTGSSNTWIGADKTYAKTTTSTSTGKSVSVSYGSGSFSGTEYTDTVTLGTGLVITKQSIGVASRATGFSGVDGILGIGPVDLTEDTVSGTSTVPTVTDNLLTQGTISSKVVGVSFAPTTSESTANGELTFGGTDSSKYTGSITYTSLTGTSPASAYWGINQALTYGSTTISASTAGIVDTGTTLLYIASDAFSKYAKATGAVYDSSTGLYSITSAQYSALQTLNFSIGGATFGLTANAQIWPRSLNTYIGGSSSKIYLIVNDIGTNTGEGLDFIDGQVFLERFYTVFDSTNNRFGIATTSSTTATSN
ncbi:family A1 protease [Stereum hirsutum FP-91666 SS1]|uniref:family A1 protease n=1 Tax=Stereum hirsutum (strain FP-91666) TaxID=721885 RepID=UPI000440DFF9|nr:family A1 protease [Stereum hirsutum FP-91666 SS1]EIM87134.1 family A1 protease [Stereum hirsutum FP-91666 SS1]